MTAKVNGFLSWKGWALIFRGRRTRALVIAMVLKQRQFELVVMYCPKSHSKSCWVFFCEARATVADFGVNVDVIYGSFTIAFRLPVFGSEPKCRPTVCNSCLFGGAVNQMEKENGMKKKKIRLIDWLEPKTKLAICYIITKQVKRLLLFLSQWIL